MRKRCNNILRVGAWNVRSLNIGEKLENLKREKKRLILDIAGVSEVTCKEDKDFCSDEYRIITTATENGITGVGFVMNRELGQRVGYSDGVVLIRIDIRATPTMIVQIYMTTSQAEDGNAEKVYEDIERVIQYVKGDENLIIIGDSKKCSNVCEILWDLTAKVISP